MRFIVDEQIPFEALDGPTFPEMCKVMCPGFSPLCRQTGSKWVKIYANDVKKKVILRCVTTKFTFKKQVEDIKVDAINMALSTDGWHSSYQNLGI